MQKRAIPILACLTLSLAASRADSPEDARLLLEKVLKINHLEPTLTADFSSKVWQEGTETQFEGSLKLKRPNLAYIETKGIGTVASDGKTVWIYWTKTGAYLKSRADPNGRGIFILNQFLFSFLYDPVRAFFAQSTSALFSEGTTVAKLSNTVEQGREYQVVEGVGNSEWGLLLAPFVGSYRERVKLFIGPDQLIEGCSSEITTRSHAFARRRRTRGETWLRNIKLRVPLDDAQFAYELPQGAKPFYDPAAKLLGVGQEAPDFTLATLSGSRIRLFEVLQNKRAVLLIFCAERSERSRSDLASVQRTYESLQSQGVEFIAINDGDSTRPIKRYAEKAGLTFPIAMGGGRRKPEHEVFGRYGVIDYPTFYLLDGSGKVIWRRVRFAEDELQSELKKIGISN